MFEAQEEGESLEPIAMPPGVTRQHMEALLSLDTANAADVLADDVLELCMVAKKLQNEMWMRKLADRFVRFPNRQIMIGKKSAIAAAAAPPRKHPWVLDLLLPPSDAEEDTPQR